MYILVLLDFKEKDSKHTLDRSRDRRISPTTERWGLHTVAQSTLLTQADSHPCRSFIAMVCTVGCFMALSNMKRIHHMVGLICLVIVINVAPHWSCLVGGLGETVGIHGAALSFDGFCEHLLYSSEQMALDPHVEMRRQIK